PALAATLPPGRLQADQASAHRGPIRFAPDPRTSRHPCNTPQFNCSEQSTSLGCSGYGRGPLQRCCGGPLGVFVRRCPTLPHPLECSTIGAGRLSFRVRYVSGRFPLAMAAVTLWRHSFVVTHGGCVFVS